MRSINKTDSVSVSSQPALVKGKTEDNPSNEAILTIKVKDKKAVEAERRAKRAQARQQLEDLGLKNVSKEHVKEVESSENGDFVTLKYDDGSKLAMKRENNREDIRLFADYDKNGVRYTIKGSNGEFTAGENVKEVNVESLSAGLIINMAKRPGVKINVAETAVNITVIPSSHVKKNVLSQEVNWFKGNAGFLWGRKETEISETTVVNPK